MTLTLELPEAVMQQLENEARRLRVSPQELAIMFSVKTPNSIVGWLDKKRER